MTFTHLAEPIPITEHNWPEGTIPLVTTKTITYMHEKYIRECIEGILMQKTTFPVQVLIHDDASTDATADIMREYERKYPKLIQCFYQKENTYRKPNRRDLMKDYHDAVAGKYIAICEGDDYWTDPLKLQKQVEFLEANPDFSICAHNALIHYEDGEKEDSLFNPTDQKPIINTEDLIRKWSFATASIVVRRSMMKRYDDDPYLKKVYNGDLFLALMMSLEGPIYYMPGLMSVYRRFNLQRYIGKESYIIRKRIELLKVFDETSELKYHKGIKTEIGILKRSLVLQTIYMRFPKLKKLYQRLKNAVR